MKILIHYIECIGTGSGSEKLVVYEEFGKTENFGTEVQLVVLGQALNVMRGNFQINIIVIFVYEVRYKKFKHMRCLKAQFLNLLLQLTIQMFLLQLTIQMFTYSVLKTMAVTC
jgi:hypothetical protein